MGQRILTICLLKYISVFYIIYQTTKYVNILNDVLNKQDILSYNRSQPR